MIRSKNNDHNRGTDKLCLNFIFGRRNGNDDSRKDGSVG